MGGRSMGRRGLAVRLPDSLLYGSISLPCSAPPAELFPFIHPGGCSGCCSGRPAVERGNRACSLFSRLLQPSFCYTQGHRGVATYNRSLAPQPCCQCLPFSYGDRSVSSPVPASGGLDGVFGSPRFLSPGSGSSIVSPLPAVLRGGLCSFVPRPLFQPFDGSSDIHACHGPDLLYHASLRLQDPAVFGRLARPRILVQGDCVGVARRTLQASSILVPMVG